MHSRLSFAGLVLVFAAGGSLAQSPETSAVPSADSHLSFAAATIKPHDPNDPCGGCTGITTEGDRVRIRNKNVSSLMQWAYAINPRQIVGAPDWFFNQTFDITGTTGIQGELKGPQFQAILQNLLADRFALKVRHEKRDLPVYAIEIAKGGPKIKPANPGEQPDGDDNRNGQDEKITLTAASLNDFATRLKIFVDRPVVDQTGLLGKYDFSLHYTVDETHTADPNAPPGIFTAVQEQLGLKLAPMKAPVDVFFIDQVRQPSAD